MPVPRVIITEEARKVVRGLVATHGPLMFHQSGGCCDVDGAPFYMGGDQFEYWRHTQLTVDVVPGRGGGFSLEAPLGVRFLIRSRVFDIDETTELDATGEPHRGP